MRKGTRCTPEKRKEVALLYVSGLSTGEIEKQTGYSHQSVSRWVREFGFTSRSLKEAAKPQMENYAYLNPEGVLVKRCGRCGDTKTIDSFEKHEVNRDGVRGNCVLCRKHINQKSYHKHKERICEEAKQKRKDDPEGERNSDLKSRFKITLEDFEKMFAEQGYACAACGTLDPIVEKRKWNVDHDHSCCPSSRKTCGNCIRGILCRDCNIALGMVKDSPQRLMQLVDYLQNYHQGPGENGYAAPIPFPATPHAPPLSPIIEVLG